MTRPRTLCPGGYRRAAGGARARSLRLRQQQPRRVQRPVGALRWSLACPMCHRGCRPDWAPCSRCGHESKWNGGAGDGNTTTTARLFQISYTSTDKPAASDAGLASDPSRHPAGYDTKPRSRGVHSNSTGILYCNTYSHSGCGSLPSLPELPCNPQPRSDIYSFIHIDTDEHTHWHTYRDCHRHVNQHALSSTPNYAYFRSRSNALASENLYPAVAAR